MSYVFLPCSGWQLLTAHFCDYVPPGGVGVLWGKKDRDDRRKS